MTSSSADFLTRRLREFFPERDVTIYLRVCGGLDGRLRSMRSVGHEHDMSAEWARQIVTSMREALKFFALDELAELERELQDALPAPNRTLEGELTAAGLVQFARSIGRPSDLAVEHWGDSLYLVRDGTAPSWELASQIAQRICRASCLVSIGTFRSGYKKFYPGLTFDRGAVELMLEHMSQWAGEFSGRKWFAVEGEVKPLRTLNRYLRTVPHLPVRSLLDEGFLFGQAPMCYRPPRKAFLAYLDYLGYEIEARFISPGSVQVEEEADFDEAPSAKFKMIEILSGAGGRLDREEFFELCVNAGIRYNTASLYTYRMALFARKAHEVVLNI